MKILGPFEGPSRDKANNSAAIEGFFERLLSLDSVNEWPVWATNTKTHR